MCLGFGLNFGKRSKMSILITFADYNSFCKKTNIFFAYFFCFSPNLPSREFVCFEILVWFCGILCILHTMSKTSAHKQVKIVQSPETHGITNTKRSWNTPIIKWVALTHECIYVKIKTNWTSKLHTFVGWHFYYDLGTKCCNEKLL